MRGSTALLVVGLVLGLAGCGHSVESPFAGTWKVMALPAGKDMTMWLVRIEARDDGLHASVLAAGIPPLASATVEEVRAEGDVLYLTFSVDEQRMAFAFHRPAGEAAPKELLGAMATRGDREFARLERTELKALDEKQAMVVYDTTGELEQALRVGAGRAREAALGQVITSRAGKSSEYAARLMLVELLAARGAEAEAREQADRAVTFAAPYGPPMKRQALTHAALQVLAAGKLPAVAVDYARQAEALLGPDAAPEEQLPVLKALTRALRGADQKDEADRVAGRVAKLEEELDGAYEKTAVPFEPAPFSGRKGQGERVVLVELFTGANCQPCAAADVAFDALLRTYVPRDVVLVQYHLNIPSYDPLTNRDGEGRAQYYRVPGTPYWVIDGRRGPPVAGGRDKAREGYTELLGTLEREVEAEAAARLQVAAERRGDEIHVTAQATGVKSEGQARLRLLLVEAVVRYTGGNRQRLHHHVVRAMPGGFKGFAIAGTTARHEVTVNVAELRKSLGEPWAGNARFQDAEGLLNLKHLKVVALVQDEATKIVSQTAQVDVAEQ